MKISITSSDVERMSAMSATERVQYLEAKFIERRQEFWLDISAGIQQQFDASAKERA